MNKIRTLLFNCQFEAHALISSKYYKLFIILAFFSVYFFLNSVCSISLCDSIEPTKIEADTNQQQHNPALGVFLFGLSIICVLFSHSDTGTVTPFISEGFIDLLKDTNVDVPSVIDVKDTNVDVPSVIDVKDTNVDVPSVIDVIDSEAFAYADTYHYSFLDISSKAQEALVSNFKQDCALALSEGFHALPFSETSYNILEGLPPEGERYYSLLDMVRRYHEHIGANVITLVEELSVSDSGSGSD